MAQKRRQVAYRVVGGLLTLVGAGWCVQWGQTVVSASPKSPHQYWIWPTFAAIVGIVIGVVLLIVGDPESSPSGKWLGRRLRRAQAVLIGPPLPVPPVTRPPTASDVGELEPIPPPPGPSWFQLTGKSNVKILGGSVTGDMPLMRADDESSAEIEDLKMRQHSDDDPRATDAPSPSPGVQPQLVEPPPDEAERQRERDALGLRRLTPLEDGMDAEEVPAGTFYWDHPRGLSVSPDYSGLRPLEYRHLTSGERVVLGYASSNDSITLRDEGSSGDFLLLALPRAEYRNRIAINLHRIKSSRLRSSGFGNVLELTIIPIDTPTITKLEWGNRAQSTAPFPPDYGDRWIKDFRVDLVVTADICPYNHQLDAEVSPRFLYVEYVVRGVQHMKVVPEGERLVLP